MKNVINILVDSVFSECLSKGRTMESSTPFIDTLLDNSLNCMNVYSYGPYTDAATKGLFCGTPTLRNYGYYYGINSSPENHYKTFHDQGYETFGLYYPYYLIGENVYKYIDNPVFIGGFEFSAIWFGKLQFYANKKKSNNLTDLEYSLVIKLMDLVFDSWLFFYKNIDINVSSTFIIKKIFNANNGSGYKSLKIEYEKFIKNKKGYIENLLDKGETHELFLINDFVYDNAIDVDWIKSNVYKKHKPFFRKLNRKEFWLNLKNNKYRISMLGKGRYLFNSAISFVSNRYSTYKSKKPKWQLSASFKSQIDAVFNSLDNRKEINKPFYVSLHTEEPHNYLAFFSYDCQDSKVIDGEFDYLGPLLNNLGKKFKGNILYQLSLRYVDFYVRRIVDELKKRNMLDNTIIVLTADHGSSYTFNPVREISVNNFHKENFKTPFLVWPSNSKKPNSDAIFSAEDVLPTIFKEAGVKKPDHYKGLEMQNNLEGRKIIVTEYMGPGCPDMFDREIWMSSRSKNYMISYKMNVKNKFDRNNFFEIYDLANDPYEFKNLRLNEKIYSNNVINQMCNAVEKRFYEIIDERDSFIYNFLGTNGEKND